MMTILLARTATVKDTPMDTNTTLIQRMNITNMRIALIDEGGLAGVMGVGVPAHTTTMSLKIR